jgi:GTP-binding protein
MFIDTAKINVASGSGGNGCNSFLRDKHLSHPRPNGGPGGNGGNVIIRSDAHVHTLLDFQYRRHFKAQNGFHGSSNNKKGSSGSDCIIKVPPGTVIKDADTNSLLRDLEGPAEEVVICKGGSGGRGNAPKKEALPGSSGEKRNLILELKVVADVGIVGFPNTGKSTFVSKVSKAHPKIADFPFTTKAPVLGIVELGKDRRFVICEIPGLVEDAHLGKGLGHRFLRHAERAKVLMHLIDMAAFEGRLPYNDYKIINQELTCYSNALAKKPQIIAANKMDLGQAKDNLVKFRSVVKKKVYPVSCLTGEGLKELLEAAYKKLQIEGAE